MLRNYVQLIPADPSLVPSPKGCLEAVALLSASLGPDGDATCDNFSYPLFFSRTFNGSEESSFDLVRCPHCQSQLDVVWWASAMNHSWQSKHGNLDARVPCCEKVASLNNLLYEPPAGFASFFIGAYATSPLQIDLVRLLERSLGCEVRQIWTKLD